MSCGAGSGEDLLCSHVFVVILLTGACRIVSPLILSGGFSLPESGSVRGLSRAQSVLAGRGTGSVEIFARAVGFGARSRLFVAFAFSFPYYSPDKPRRSLWTLLDRLKSVRLIKMLLVIIGL